MSASFLLSSSLLPDMVDSLPNALGRAVLLNKTSRKVSPRQKNPAAQELTVQIGAFVARTDWFVSAHRPAVWSVADSRSRVPVLVRDGLWMAFRARAKY